MAGQLPEGTAGTAACVLLYSFVNLFSVLVVVWLTWHHNERLTYVACLSYLVALGVTASIVQQFHDALFWRDIVAQQFANRQKHPDNPQLVIANSPLGLDLGLFYIQYYTYNAEALFTMFWSIQLVQRVYGLSMRAGLCKIMRTDEFGRVFSLVVPIITIPCLSIKRVQKNLVGFIVLADIPMMLSLFVSSVLVLAILGKYIHTRREVLQYYNSRPQTRGLYDRWLIARFSVALVVLLLFQVSNIVFQFAAIKQARKDAGGAVADQSAGHCRKVLLLFMPGVTPGLLLFVVFGLTRTYRQYLCRTLVPQWGRQWWQTKHVAEPPVEFSERCITRRDRHTLSIHLSTMPPSPPRPAKAYQRGGQYVRVKTTDSVTQNWTHLEAQNQSSDELLISGSAYRQ